MYPQPIPFLLNNWPLVLVMVISGGMLLWPLIQRQLSPSRAIGAPAATQLINRQNALMLDLRDSAQYSDGRVPNAVNIPLAELGSRGQDLAKYKGRPVIAYCERGNQSRGAAAVLATLGFTDVFTLDGGLRAWSAAGMPIEKG